MVADSISVRGSALYPDIVSCNQETYEPIKSLPESKVQWNNEDGKKHILRATSGLFPSDGWRG